MSLFTGIRVEADVESASRDTRARGYAAEVTSHYGDVAARWQHMIAGGSASPFQHAAWLSSWYETLGRQTDVTPLLVTISDGAQDVAGFPLILRRCRGLRIVEGADLGMTDYNGPILSRAAPGTRREARRLVASLLRALPPADIISLTKMPARLGRFDNPVTLAGKGGRSALTAWPLMLGDSFEDWLGTLSSNERYKTRRKWKGFQQLPGARNTMASSKDEFARLYDGLREIQARRLAELGREDVLSLPENRAFYDRLVDTGSRDGSLVIAALETEGQMIAGLMGVLQGDHLAITRLALADGPWKKFSPGILLVHEVIRDLHAQGVRCFDFTIGSYGFKSRLGATATALYDYEAALSPLGLPLVLSSRLRCIVRNNPRLRNAVRRLRGRDPIDEAQSILSLG